VNKKEACRFTQTAHGQRKDTNSCVLSLFNVFSKKKGSIAISVFTALLVICTGAIILNICTASKYNTKTDYEKIKNRYIAESASDTSVSLLLNYIENREMVLEYEMHTDGSFFVLPEYSPFLLDEIKYATSDEAEISLISTETKNYLLSSGCLDFMREDSELLIKVKTFGDKEKFRITEMCTEPDFLLSDVPEEEDTEKRSKLNPIYITVKSKYNSGEVKCSIVIDNLYAVRGAFKENETNCPCHIDTSNAEIKYENYQNYGRDVS